jgi:hypothetical protein
MESEGDQQDCLMDLLYNTDSIPERKGEGKWVGGRCGQCLTGGEGSCHQRGRRPLRDGPKCRPLEESDQAGCYSYCDGRSMSPALTDHTTCPVGGCTAASCWKIPAAATAYLLKDPRDPYHARKAGRPMPSLWLSLE